MCAVVAACLLPVWHGEAGHCLCMVLLVKMPSRGDTLQWLGDNVRSLSGKVADILKLDVSITASPAVSATRPQISDGKEDAEQVTHSETVFSDSFSPTSEQANVEVLPDSDAQGPTVDVDAVTDAVSRLTVASAAANDANAERNISSAAASVGSAAAPEEAAEAGAVGGRSNDSLLSLLAQFADETVQQ